MTVIAEYHLAGDAIHLSVPAIVRQGEHTLRRGRGVSCGGRTASGGQNECHEPEDIGRMIAALPCNGNP